MKATDPDGAVWRVKRIWTPWRVRHRWPFGTDGLELLVAALATIWLPIEFLIALLAGAVLHATGRPWRVVAVRKGEREREQLTWKVSGARASRDKAEELAERIGRGDPGWSDGAERRLQQRG